MNWQFPHISRFFSARTVLWGEKLGLWSLLVILLTINVVNRYTSAPVSKNTLAVLLSPQSSQAHIKLAMDYWNNKNLEVAQRELLLANERMRLQTKKTEDSPRVLGVTTSPLDLLTQWQEEPVRLENTYQFWKRIAAEKQDYRDAQLMAGLLAWQLGYTKEAKAHAAILQNIDGVSEKIKTMIGVLSSE